MTSGLDASVRLAPPLVCIDLRGEVTTFAEEPLMRAYRQASEHGLENILINLTEVDYLNSAGIAVIIGIIGESRKADQRVLLTGLTPHYQMIFDIMGLTSYATICETEDAARESVQDR